MDKTMEQQTGSLDSGIEMFLSEDGCQVFVKLRDNSRKVTREEVVRCLEDISVTTGIMYDAIDAMLAKNKIGVAYPVAECTKAVDGRDGWFEFLFETDVDTKPKILQDGSVDYSAYGEVPSVEEGEKIAVYHPAIPGEDSVNYRGETIVAYKGKELARLKGKGFYVSEDGRSYFAKTAGRAMYQKERLTVENELVIEGDVSLSTGDINFSNDIHIRGNVLTGVVVATAKGSIVVDGYVEASELYAGKDVVLKNGMQGNGKGKIIAGGSVSGKFFEQVHIEAKEDVRANAIMNSYVKAVRDVEVSGKFGIIIGGEVTAERYITATIIGNMSEVRTNIRAGVEENLFSILSEKEREQRELETELKKITDGIAKIDAVLKKGPREDLQMQKVKLIRAKISKENTINGKIQEKQKIMDSMSRANVATIKVQKSLYPGTNVSINGVKAQIKEETYHAVITAKGRVLQIDS